MSESHMRRLCARGEPRGSSPVRRRYTPSRALLAALALAAIVPCRSAAAQADTDVILGRVTKASNDAPVAGAIIVATRAPDRASLTTTTGTDGRYRLVVSNGTGDYLVHVAAAGFQTARRRVTRQEDETVLRADFRLPKGGTSELARVVVTAPQSKPSREPASEPEPGADEQLAGGVSAVLRPDQAGDILAVANTVPGVTLSAGGVTVLGLPAAQSAITLNGMAFPGTTLPRDAVVQTKVATSTYDPARGWFSGANVEVDLSGGGLFTHVPLHVTVENPRLERGGVLGAAGELSRVIASTGGNGTLQDDRWFFSYGIQASRQARPAFDVFGADASVLDALRVTPDSLHRLETALRGLGLDQLTKGARAGANDVSVVARFDHEPFDWNRLEEAKSTWSITVFGKRAREDGVGFEPLNTPEHIATRSSTIGSVQALYSTYLRHDWLSETKTALSVSDTRVTPDVQLPEGRLTFIRDSTVFEPAFAPFTFGGIADANGALRRSTWETTNETQFYSSAHGVHRVKLSLDLRRDAYARIDRANSRGTFTYASATDLATDTPTSFSRLLGNYRSAVSVWNAFAALGDLWRLSPTFQLLYGARLEGNVFTTRAPEERTVMETFGVHPLRAPDRVQLSPRVGFTWVRTVPDRSAIVRNSFGQFPKYPSGYLRGGIGEFRNLMTPDILSRSVSAIGLAGGPRQLYCIGDEVPRADWQGFAQSPATIPSACATASTAGAVGAAPSVELLGHGFDAPRSWRANLGYSSAVARLAFTIDGVYSLDFNQASSRDLNFRSTPAFLATDEGRPIFVPPGSIVPATGAVSPLASRQTAQFGAVTERLSDGRSIARQLSIAVAPIPTALPARVYASFTYTLASSRTLARGFDGTAFQNPASQVWTRGNLDVRHRLMVQGGIRTALGTFTLYGRLNSGLPFTPVVGQDVNGDGVPNDRAFIFARGGGDTSVTRALSALIATEPPRIQQCLERQRGRPAAANSCEGPWTATVDAQFRVTPRIGPNGRVANIVLSLMNPLGGIDEALHGASHLRGWGTMPSPDPVLYEVRGFDPSAERFRYGVNSAFGRTDALSTVMRPPFGVAVDVSVDLAPPPAEQQLHRWLNQGREGYHGRRFSVEDLMKRYVRTVPDPYRAILVESDSLLLTRDQSDALARQDSAYRVRVDSVWTTLATYLTSLPDSYDIREALRRQASATDSVWELSRRDVQQSLPSILSAIQRRLLPWPANILLEARTPIKDIRLYISG